MDFHIISERQNPVMKRRELFAEIKYTGPTPSKAHIQEHVSAKLSVNPESVEISKILSEHGKSKGKAWIKIWEHKKVQIYSQAKEGKTEDAPTKTEEKK